MGGCVATELDVTTTPDERGVGATVGAIVIEGKENTVILVLYYFR